MCGALPPEVDGDEPPISFLGFWGADGNWISFLLSVSYMFLVKFQLSGVGFCFRGLIFLFCSEWQIHVGAVSAIVPFLLIPIIYASFDVMKW